MKNKEYDDEQKIYYENGNIKEVYHYLKGKKNGVHLLYNENQIPILVEFYKTDKLIEKYVENIEKNKTHITYFKYNAKGDLIKHSEYENWEKLIKLYDDVINNKNNKSELHIKNFGAYEVRKIGKHSGIILYHQ